MFNKKKPFIREGISKYSIKIVLHYKLISSIIALILLFKKSIFFQILFFGFKVNIYTNIHFDFLVQESRIF